MGLLQYEPKTNSISKGWFKFKLNSAEDVEKILKQHWSYGTVPIMLKKWTPLFDADNEKLDPIPV